MVPVRAVVAGAAVNFKEPLPKPLTVLAEASAKLPIPDSRFSQDVSVAAVQAQNGSLAVKKTVPTPPAASMFRFVLEIVKVQGLATKSAVSSRARLLKV